MNQVNLKHPQHLNSAILNYSRCVTSSSYPHGLSSENGKSVKPAAGVISSTEGFIRKYPVKADLRLTFLTFRHDAFIIQRERDEIAK